MLNIKEWNKAIEIFGNDLKDSLDSIKQSVVYKTNEGIVILKDADSYKVTDNGDLMYTGESIESCIEYLDQIYA